MQDILDRAPRPLTLLLVVAALIATVWQFYRFWLDINTPYTAPVATETMVDNRVEVPAVDFAAINFFGVATEGDEDGPVDTENLPETNLRLVLRGVGASVEDDFPGSLSSALVEGPNKQTDYYVLGDTLPGDATLKAVYPDRIVLSRQGAMENLYFPEEFETASLSVSDRAPAVARSTPPAASQPAPVSTAEAQAEEDRKAEIRARLQRLRERLRQNN